MNNTENIFNSMLYYNANEISLAIGGIADEENIYSVVRAFWESYGFDVTDLVEKLLWEYADAVCAEASWI